MGRVIVPVPDRDFDVTEVAIPWLLLTRAGHHVVFATERGDAPATGDPRLLGNDIFGRVFGAKADARAAYAQMIASAEFQNPLSWHGINVASFDGLLLPGGHAPGMRQYLESQAVQEKVAQFWILDRPVAAICHGVLILARARNPNTGEPLIADSRTTCLPKYLETVAFLLTCLWMGRYFRTYTTYVEDEVKASLKNPHTQFERGPLTGIKRGTAINDRPAFTVKDGRYLSGRWPGDAYKLAKEFIAQLDAAEAQREVA